MPTAKSGDTVRFHYTGTLEDGSRFDTSTNRQPIEVTLGQGDLMAGIEQALVGMEPGQNRTVSLTAEEAYGPHRPELVQEVERTGIPEDIDLQVGAILRATGPDGKPHPLTILEVTETTVTLDQNHPLAGKDLTFDLELVEIV